MTFIWATQVICLWFGVSNLAYSNDSPSPATLESRSQAALQRVKDACVSVEGGSGVIISPDGYVLTAAHVVGGKRYLRVQLDSGRKAIAIPVGADRTADVALLKIAALTETFEELTPEDLTPREIAWPNVELAEKGPQVGSFCFLLGHPGARMSGRSAQFRFGRVTHEHTTGPYFDADCTIQPGDSGCGLFDLESRLVGLGIHATPYPGANTFTDIKALLVGRKRMEAGENWGEQMAHDQVLAEEDQNKIVAILRQKYEDLKGTRYQPILESFLKTHSSQTNEAALSDPLALAGGLDYRAMAALRGVPCGFGMQDPKVVELWPVSNHPITKPVRVFADSSLQSYGLPVSKRHLIVKWNLFQEIKSLNVQVGDTLKIASFLNGNSEWDLALFDLEADLLTPVKFADSETFQAQALAAPDADGLLLWGFTCDGPREIKGVQPVGPFYNPEFISRFRGPYQRATLHGLPLTSRDAGRPLYNLNGECVGAHMARCSRSSGLLIAGSDINAVYRQWIKEGAKPGVTYPRRDAANTKAIDLRRTVSEKLAFSEVALMISFYLDANSELPRSLDDLDEGDIKKIRKSNEQNDIRMIYLGGFSKRAELENPSVTPVLISPARQGKHTVGFADGNIERITTDSLQLRLKKLDIAMPPGATPIEPK